MPTTRQRLVAAVLRRYPLYSSCGTLANRSWVKAMAGPGDGIGWGRVKGGMYVASPLNDYLGRAVYYVGENDAKVTWACQRLVRPGDVVLDIGANIGLVTFVLADLVGPRGQVHAYEPNPRLCDLIERSRQRNGADNVTLHRVAVGAREGHAVLNVPAGHAAAAFLAEGQTDSGESVDVPVRPLGEHGTDSELLGQPRVRLIKIDVEGYEEDVLEGALPLLASESRPFAILFEFAQNVRGHIADPRQHQIITTLEACGYEFIGIPRNWIHMYGRRIDLADAHPSEFTHDILAVPAGADYEEACTLLAAR
jgi:FkbM family methyltransferase